jgi:hypothetical protein
MTSRRSHLGPGSDTDDHSIVIESEVHRLDRRKGPVSEGDPTDRHRLEQSQALDPGQYLKAGRVKIHYTCVIWSRSPGDRAERPYLLPPHRPCTPTPESVVARPPGSPWFMGKGRTFCSR